MNKRKLLKTIQAFLNDGSKKSYPKIVVEFIYLWVLHKEFPAHYVTRFLYRKEHRNYRDFIPTKKYFKLIYSERTQNEFYVSILSNKLLFSFFCTNSEIPIPLLTGYNSQEHFYIAKQKYVIKSSEDLIIFFSKAFTEYQCEEIFVKSLSAKGGAGIHQLQKKNLKRQIEVLSEVFLSNSFVHQIGVQQHPEIDKIYSHSLNTIRFDVCTIDDRSVLVGAVMRFGAGGSVIDNRSKGGFFVSINDKDGTLLKKGQMQMGFGGLELYKHPDTDFVFEGFKIPYYSQAKMLALKMSSLLPNKIVGWDIAITPEGPVVIEGNHDSNITMTELQYGGYLKHPIIKELLAGI